MPCFVCAVAVGEEDHIVSMSVSPSEETVACATSSQQLIVHTLSSSDLTKVPTHPRYTDSRRERECAVAMLYTQDGDFLHLE